MAKLTRYDLTYNKKTGGWGLEFGRGKVKSFESKADATAGGALSELIGRSGGSVRIHKMNGRIQEERTFPRSADPKKSPG